MKRLIEFGLCLFAVINLMTASVSCLIGHVFDEEGSGCDCECKDEWIANVPTNPVTEKNGSAGLPYCTHCSHYQV